MPTALGALTFAVVLIDHRPLAELAGTPVAIELLAGSMPLHQFEHPDDAVYVFGPEDGSIPKGVRACHAFVAIPSKHCLNLAAAVYVTLWHRTTQRWERGLDPMPVLDEERGYVPCQWGDER